jgi:cell division protein FtsB
LNRRGRLVTAFAITVISLAALNWLATPYLLWYNRLNEAKQLQTQLTELEKRLREVRRQAARLKTQAGMEEEARRQGWRNKDEVPVIVVPEKPSRIP